MQGLAVLARLRIWGYPRLIPILLSTPGHLLCDSSASSCSFDYTQTCFLPVLKLAPLQALLHPHALFTDVARRTVILSHLPPTILS